MPLISRLGAASSRGFGEFNQQAQGNYIEDYFSTYLYTGTGASQTITNGIGLSSTSAWSAISAPSTAGSPITYGLGVTTDSSGNYYVSGISYDGTDFYDLLLKYNSSGTLQWQKKYKYNSPGRPSNGGSVAVDSSGNVYTTGYAYDGTRNAISIVKYDSSGNLTWQRIFYSGASQGYGIALDTSGNVYVCGSIKFGVNDIGVLVKYNSSGTLQWQTTLGTTGSASLRGVACDSSGNVYVAGYVQSGLSILAKFNSAGTIQWQISLNQTNSYFYGVAVDSSGNVYVTGNDNPGGNTYIQIAKYNTSGTLQWQRKLSQGVAQGNGICVDSSSNVYVTGVANDGTDYIAVAAYNTNGTLQWQSKIRQNASQGRGIAVNNATNTLYVTGYATNVQNYCLVVVLPSDGSATSGNAIVNLLPGTATAATSTATSSSSSAYSQTSGTDAAGGATVSTGNIVSTYATQAAVTGAGGLVWMKGRSGATDHALYDTARGVQKDLGIANAGAPQTTETQGLTAFGSANFTIGSLAKINTSSATYSSWTFRKAPKFFTCVTYTGTGTARTVAHDLGSVPGMIIVKCTSAIDNWAVYHRSLGATKYIYLDDTQQAFTATSPWNNTEPTSTAFTVGTASFSNTNGRTYVAYLFAHDAGGFGADGLQNVISCGSGSWNGGSDNAVTLGYEPQWIMYKRTDASANWFVYDTMRGMSYSSSEYLRPNISDAAGTYSSPYAPYPTATGFVIPSGTISTGTYIYMAIRRGPMRTPTDATKVFNPVTYTGTGVGNRVVSVTNQPDSVWWASRTRTAYADNYVFDRLRGVLNSGGSGTGGGLKTNRTDAEYPNSAFQISALNNTSVQFGASAFNGLDLSGLTGIFWNFTRAPGFFDEVCASNFSNGATISHSLGVVPELIIAKARNDSIGNWMGSYKDGTAVKNISLNVATAAYDPSLTWSSYFTSTTINPAGILNAAGGGVKGTNSPTVIYLFATCPGVSKVGSYTGTGTTKQIDCGFTAGARFVLIKRTDSTGDWYVYDTARGIIAGNDPYLLLNSTAAEVTNTDYVDTYAAGFELSSTAPAGLNANGGTYIFLAIA